MAHEIESMFFVGETPWHGLGTRLGEAPSVADAIKEAGLNWQVKTVPLFTAGGDEVPARATVRETDGRVLGVVGERYTVLQNDKAFNFFDPFVQSGLVSLETAGSLRDGQRVWVLARINEGGSDTDIVKGDAVRKFLMLSNSHDGTLAVRVGFTPVRIVCANTLAIAHTDGQSALIRLRHSSAVASNLEALRETINIANRSFEATAEQYRALAARQINAKDLEAYIKRVLGHGATETNDLSTRAQNQIAEIVTLFEHGRGNDMAGVRGTIWAAYNAVTEYLTHASGADADKRYSSLWFGTTAQRNSSALTEAVTLLAA